MQTLAQTTGKKRYESVSTYCDVCHNVDKFIVFC